MSVESNLATGYVRIYRALAEHPIWENSDYLRIWLHLLFAANWKDRQLLDGTLVKRGSLMTGRVTIGLATKTSEQTVRSCLKCLISTSMITIESTNRGSIVTICNYDTYQPLTGVNQPAEKPTNQPTFNQQPTNSQPATNQPTNHSEEVKKERIKEVTPPYPPQGGLFGDDETPTKKRIRKAKPEPAQESAEFVEFYALYPRHVGRAPACEAWNKHVHNGDGPKVIAGLRAALPALNRAEEDKRPHPATWLGQERWRDCEGIKAPEKPKDAYLEFLERKRAAGK